METEKIKQVISLLPEFAKYAKQLALSVTDWATEKDFDGIFIDDQGCVEARFSCYKYNEPDYEAVYLSDSDLLNGIDALRLAKAEKVRAEKEAAEIRKKQEEEKYRLEKERKEKELYESLKKKYEN